MSKILVCFAVFTETFDAGLGDLGGVLGGISAHLGGTFDTLLAHFGSKIRIRTAEAWFWFGIDPYII